MTNPDLPGSETAVVTREAFEDNWSDKGFKLSDRKGNVVSDEPEPEPAAEDASSTRRTRTGGGS